VPADPSPSQLPPGMVSVVRDTLAESGHEHRTDALVGALAPLLDALLVQRDERWQLQLASKVAEHQECRRDRSRLEAEARRLREALEEIDRWAKAIADGRAICGAETALAACGGIARGALSASPDPEMSAGGDENRTEQESVSVPEQEEERA
jgi:hypothetical protein